jgi:hypothetical protein
MEEDQEEGLGPLGQELSRQASGASLPSGGHPPELSGDDAAGGLLPAPDEEGGRQIAVPTDNQLQLMLASAGDGCSLAELEKAAATLLGYAKRQKHMKEELFKVAEWHLRVKRKLGTILKQTVSWGGDRSRSHDATLLDDGLPCGVDKHAAKRFRRLADIEDSVFQHYLAKTRQRSGTPSEAGAIRSAAPGVVTGKVSRKQGKRSKNGIGAVEVSPQVLDAIERCLGDIDVCVGGTKVKCRRRVAGAKLTVDDLQGIVFVTARVDPAIWLEKLVEMKNSAQCQQAIVLMPARTGASWFRQFSGANWHLYFLEDPDEPTVAAYIGTRSRAFFAVMHDHGLVVIVDKQSAETRSPISESLLR